MYRVLVMPETSIIENSAVGREAVRQQTLVPRLDRLVARSTHCRVPGGSLAS